MNPKRKSCAVILPLLFTLALTSCGAKECPKEDYLSTLSWHEDFSVLQLTDIHWSVETDREHEKAYLRQVIEAARNAAPTQTIDFLMITGDSGLVATKEILSDLYSFLQSFDIPYGVTWGNHDKQGTYSLEWLDSLVSKGNSVYRCPNDEVTGRSNYTVDIKDGDKTEWQIFSLDSNSYRPSSVPLVYDYDYIREDQVKWFEKMAEDVPSLGYFHIPLCEWNDALNNKDSLTEKTKWTIGEKFCPSSVRSDFFQSAKAHDVKGLFCGHDHANDWTATYDGVVIGYGVKSGKELYYHHDDTRNLDMIGGSLSLLHSDGTFTLRHVYVQDDADYTVSLEDY
jgi:hypothetical protein